MSMRKAVPRRKPEEVLLQSDEEREKWPAFSVTLPKQRGVKIPTLRAFSQTAEAYMGGNSLKLHAMPPYPEEAALVPHCVNILGRGKLAIDDAMDAVVRGGLR